MLKEEVSNQICHICLDDFKVTESIKPCGDAYICKECIQSLIDNNHDKCPICKQDLILNKSLCEKIIDSRLFIFVKYLCLYYSIAVFSVSCYILFESL